MTDSEIEAAYREYMEGFVDAYLPLDAPRMPVDDILRNL